MILIVGGAFQGKLDYALELTGYKREDFVDGGSCEWEDVFRAKGIVHFHEYVRRSLKRGRDCTELAERIFEKNPEIVIVTNELGYGIVPVEAFDRKWRETTGRVCSTLAGMSGKVCRVVCGIGMVLKDDSEH